MTNTTITRERALAALDAVKAQWADDLAPSRFPAEYDETGALVGEELNFEPLYPQPVLVDNFAGEGEWAIVWEEGPDEWAYRVNSGEPSESNRVLFAQASEEFGVALKAPHRAPVVWPADVEAEAYYSFVLTLRAAFRPVTIVP